MASLLTAGLCVAYVVLRFALPSDSTLFAAQLVYLAGPLLALIFSARSSIAAPADSRGRIVWGLVALTMMVLLFSEALYSWDALTPDTARVLLGAADALNLLSFVLLTTMMSVGSGVHSLSVRRKVTLVVDLAIVLVAAFLMIYLYWSRILSGVPSAPSAIIPSLYSLSGVFVFSYNALVWFGSGSQRLNSGIRILVTAIAVYSIGVIAWPLWRMAPGSEFQLAEAAVTLVFLLGYLLVFVAGVQRLHSRDEPWLQTAPTLKLPRSPMVDMALAAVASLTILVAGVMAYGSQSDRIERTVLFAVVYSLSILLLARSALVAHHIRALESNHRQSLPNGTNDAKGFNMQLAEYHASAIRFSEGFVLVMMECVSPGPGRRDESSSSNSVSASDVAKRLAQRFSGIGHVNQVSDTQIALLAVVGSRNEGSLVAESAREVAQSTMTADQRRHRRFSVGFVMCPDDAVQLNGLLDKALTALAWASLHRGGTATAYTEAIARASAVNSLAGSDELPFRSAVVRALRAAADTRDPHGAAHVRSVAVLSRLLGEHSGCEGDHLDRIQMAGLLHDVGKIAPPLSAYGDRISDSSPGSLCDEHFVIGAQLLASSGVEGASEWVLHLGERWDGGGRPSGLKGAEIPLESRIITIADHYHSTVSGRSYGAPMSEAAALQVIDHGLGTLFDPQLAEGFIALIGTTPFRHTASDWIGS